MGADAFARYAHVVADAGPVLVALHTDHCPPNGTWTIGYLRLVREAADESLTRSGLPFCVDHPPTLIAANYHRFAQRCCRTGARTASLGAHALKLRNA